MVKKKSTQEQKKENYLKFMAWKEGMTEEDFKQIVSPKGTLSRKEIAAQCGFGRSSINSNTDIQRELSKLEEQLRTQKILPQKVSKSTDDALPKRDKQNSKNLLNSKKLTRLEQEVTALKAENQKFRLALKKYQLLEEVLDESGRIPR